MLVGVEAPVPRCGNIKIYVQARPRGRVHPSQDCQVLGLPKGTREVAGSSTVASDVL